MTIEPSNEDGGTEPPFTIELMNTSIEILPVTYDREQDSVIDYTDFLVELRQQLESTAKLATVYEGPFYNKDEGLSSVLVEDLYDNYDIGHFDGEIFLSRSLLKFLDNSCPVIGDAGV